MGKVEVLDRLEMMDVRRVIVNGQLWFVAKDVCAAIGVSKYRAAVARLDAGERDLRIVDTPGGNQKMVVVDEYGLYQLIISSRSPEAVKYRRRVLEMLSGRAFGGKYRRRILELAKAGLDR